MNKNTTKGNNTKGNNTNENIETDNIDSNESIKKNQPYVEWSEDHENILVDWADKALCYKWLHNKAHVAYSTKNTWFTIPVIIMSTLTGTANFAQDRIPPEYLNAATMGIGAVNLIAGILTTIQQFLKITELNESHRVSSIAWGKFYRNVKIEISKSPIERTPVVQLLKHAKEEFDRLVETSPTQTKKLVKVYQNNGPTKLEIENNNNKIIIEAFIEKFNSEKKRYPTKDEVIDNLDGSIHHDFINIVYNNAIQNNNIVIEIYSDSIV